METDCEAGFVVQIAKLDVHWFTYISRMAMNLIIAAIVCVFIRMSVFSFGAVLHFIN